MSQAVKVVRARTLGCGSSGGVPRLDGDWGRCDPKNPKNRRQRCSLLIEAAQSLQELDTGPVTRVLVDTSPDLRTQWLQSGATTLDGVVYTHAHADQLHGIDDLRALVYRRMAVLPAYANPVVADEITQRFNYIFETPAGSGYPPIMTMEAKMAGDAISIEGPGGLISLALFSVEHGGAACSGVRAGPLAYTPDVNDLDREAFAAMDGVTVWIVDALREKPHPTHAHVDLSLEWIAMVQPKLGVLTNMHVDLDYSSLCQRLPESVRPAYDGFDVTIAWDSGEIVSVCSR